MSISVCFQLPHTPHAMMDSPLRHTRPELSDFVSYSVIALGKPTHTQEGPW